MKSVWTLGVLGLGVLAVGLLSACEGMPNEALERQQQDRLDQVMPGPTDLPPGLSADLPAKASEPVSQAKVAKDN